MSSELALPLNAVTQKLAFIGISGSGKTFAAGKFCEELLGAGAQVVVLDVIGSWWGLRLKADGKTPAFRIPVLGGARGDVPLEFTAGSVVADAVAETRSSMILDVSDFTGGELRRFAGDFAVQLLRRKKMLRSPVMIVIEECQDLLPQFVDAKSAPMVGAWQRLTKQGRNFGIGVALITQRPQAVSKEVLNQIETLFVFRTGGAQERKAIHAWITHHSVDVGALVDELPSLATGKCFVWSPQWLKVLAKFTIAKKKTFDASATPEYGADAVTGVLQPIDLEALKKTMASTVERAMANDPAVLRKRIAELERDLKAAVAKAPGVKTKVVEKRVVPPADIKRLEKEVASLNAWTARLEAVVGTATASAERLTEALRSAGAPHPVPTTFVRLGETPPPPANGISKSRAAANEVRGVTLGKCAQAILRALAWREPGAITRTQVATLSGYSQNSSGFANALSTLHASSLIRKEMDRISLSELGRAVAPRDPPPPPLEMWCGRLAGKQALMLRKLVVAGAEGVLRDALAEQVDLSPTSSGYANYLSGLHANGLVVKHGPIIVASQEFLS